MCCTNDIKITFIVPAYNEEERIQRCIDSIIMQNRDDLEVIIVDDASVDQTYQIMLKNQQRYSCIKCLHNQINQGAGNCRNQGLENAKGDYIWFVDADDFIYENAVDMIMPYLEQKELDILIFDQVRKTVFGDSVNPYKMNSDSRNVYSGTEMYRLIATKNNMRAGVCGEIYSRDFIRKVGLCFSEGTMAEDAFFSLKAILKADRTFYLNKALYCYHKSENSITTSTQNRDYFLGTFRAYVEMLLFWEENTWDMELESLISKYISQYLFLAKETFSEIDSAYIENWMRKNDKKLLKYFQMFQRGINTAIYIWEIPDNVRGLLEREKRIIIYGAGDVAKEFAQIWRKSYSGIIEYVVSDNMENVPSAIYGIPVKRLSELSERDKVIPVIIAMLPDKSKQVVSELQKRGFHNWVFLIRGQ